ncbi:hypothetical protein CHLNCDRAFT_133200 [Chlorella variabilis]|uniref:Homeobox domain-containing protein n=1 Tax=Chlorella variabilis TaxID=554065 RepID=E1Z2K9_CHLVA|nr:hypothetical protein CHLNCDRAFT_133200 [Chlorella variabilis]EFN59681.1 hypothetical protein CHLNCDRAFT_133200 [Chlorella variabilis]|eukprot:XP_005851783.1 hypothetical protein CHLNCDRAFT_133200 [Chlorella variabilis]
MWPLRCARRKVVVRAAGDELEAWQVTKLQQALTAGRRQVKVEKLCKELGLPRQTVLQWLKGAPPPDRAQQSLLEAQVAAEQAAAERQAILQQPQAQRAAAPGARSAAKRPAAAPGPGGSYGPGGTPAWKHYHKKKALGRQAEATLEMIFTRTQWPSDEAVSSLWDLHRLPREKALDWFKQRRRQEQQQLRGGVGKRAAKEAGAEESTRWAAESDAE